MLYQGKILAGIVVFLLCIGSVFGQSPSEADKSVYRILAKVPGGMATGSGFLIAEKNYVLTNYHVVENASEVLIGFNGATGQPKTLPAKIEWKSAQLDIAVLKTNQDLPGSPLALMGQAPPNFPEKETEVTSIGYPGAADDFTKGTGLSSEFLTSSRTRGVVSRVFKGSFGKHEHYVIQHDAEISPGNSGGPLVDLCQRVLGINTWGKGDILVATHASVAIAALRSNKIPILVVDSPCNSVDRNTGPNYNNYLIGLLILVIIAMLVVWFNRKNNKPAIADRQPVPSPQPDAPKKFMPVPRQHVIPLVTKENRYIIFKTSRGVLGRIAENSSVWFNEGVLVGRDSDICDIVIDDETVSRKHFRLLRGKSGLTLEDCNSLAGTLVNSTPVVNPIHLNNIDDGVVIEIGQSRITIVAEK